jgi:hypothetical protein
MALTQGKMMRGGFYQIKFIIEEMAMSITGIIIQLMAKSINN